MCEANGNVNSFLCPNGTMFNQQYFICDWWYNVDCGATTNFYALNEFIYEENPNGKKCKTLFCMNDWELSRTDDVTKLRSFFHWKQVLFFVPKLALWIYDDANHVQHFFTMVCALSCFNKWTSWSMNHFNYWLLCLHGMNDQRKWVGEWKCLNFLFTPP